MGEDALMDRSQMERGPSDSIGESRAVEAKALALINLRLAIERRVIGVFGDEHVGDRRLARQAALGQPRRHRRLDDVLARATGIFGPARSNPPLVQWRLPQGN